MSTQGKFEEVHVQVSNRHFVVSYDDEGARIIKERVIYAEGAPWESLYNAPRWHRNRHGWPKRKTGTMAQVIAAANTKRAVK